MRTPTMGRTLSCCETSMMALELLDLFDDHDDGLAQLAAEQRHLDVERVLIAVADEEALGIAMDGERGEEFRLAADLEAELVGRAGVHDFLHDFAELVDLDREDAAVLTPW